MIELEGYRNIFTDGVDIYLRLSNDFVKLYPMCEHTDLYRVRRSRDGMTVNVKKSTLLKQITGCD